jgi:RNA polymerase sigma-70 factor (ECF subfamily)
MATELYNLEQVYEQYLDPIYRFLYARVGNREDAEDLTSQVFLKALRSLDIAYAEHSIAGWLFTVARTVLADHWRREYRHGTMAELDENLTDRAETVNGTGDTETVHRVEEILAFLPARYRAVLELRFLRGYTLEETAQELGITTGNVKIIQHRALAKAVDVMETRAVCALSPARQGQAIA